MFVTIYLTAAILAAVALLASLVHFADELIRAAVQGLRLRHVRSVRGLLHYLADEIVMRWQLRHVRRFGGPYMHAQHLAYHRAAAVEARRRAWAATPVRTTVTVGDPGRAAGQVLDGELVA